MLVGNDIVDLHDPESRPGALHARFDARVFTPAEREALSVSAPASASRHELRWTLWAAKESAYKVAKKLDPAVRFLPRGFVVRRITEGRAVVMHQTGSFDVQLDRTDEWVRAVATVSAASAPSTTRPVSGGVERLKAPGADPSRTVRELACEALGSWMNLPPGQVQIAADRGIPVALWRNRRLPVDLSLSHHGRFVAWAWTGSLKRSPSVSKPAGSPMIVSRSPRSSTVAPLGITTSGPRRTRAIRVPSGKRISLSARPMRDAEGVPGSRVSASSRSSRSMASLSS